MLDFVQELMTPREAAKWFRRSPAWLRQQRGLLRVAGPGGQPLYHIAVCRAYVFGRMCRIDGDELQRVQIDALQAAAGIAAPPARTADARPAPDAAEISNTTGKLRRRRELASR